MSGWTVVVSAAVTFDLKDAINADLREARVALEAMPGADIHVHVYLSGPAFNPPQVWSWPPPGRAARRTRWRRCSPTRKAGHTRVAAASSSCGATAKGRSRERPARGAPRLADAGPTSDRMLRPRPGYTVSWHLARPGHHRVRRLPDGVPDDGAEAGRVVPEGAVHRLDGPGTGQQMALLTGHVRSARSEGVGPTSRRQCLGGGVRRFRRHRRLVPLVVLDLARLVTGGAGLDDDEQGYTNTARTSLNQAIQGT